MKLFRRRRKDNSSAIKGTIVRKSRFFNKGMPIIRFGSYFQQVFWLIKVDGSAQILPFRIILYTVSSTFANVPFGSTPRDGISECVDGDRVEINRYKRKSLIFKKGDEMLDAILGADVNFTDRGKWVTVEPVYQARETNVHRI